ncbi:hypothetical protein FUA23_02190 [Neolewinella aurantiaca]|uniref:Tail specific protease domain-containing protein n=1 Tax=Neolewinella aurantiaca TaxID=2602767 RepID=A0A5C7FXL8_9BACT|nr:S41 family peptidase [Neolewinella aurantiaca]TXF91528.1 hypothetical protein FUA23_02190 [Neolewinella aurantiaca]
MIRFIALLLCSTSLLSAQKMFPADAAQEAAEEIYLEIKERHPYPATIAGLRALDSARTQVQKQLAARVNGHDSIAYHEFVGLVSPLQEATNCGHLILGPYLDSVANREIRENNFPLYLIQIETGEYVLHSGISTATDSLSPGTVVTALNGENIKTVIGQIAPFSGINDDKNDEALLYKVARAPMFLYQTYYGIQDSIIITIRNETGPENRTVFPKMVPYTDPKKSKTPIAKTLDFKFSEDGETGILKIKKFSSYKFTDGNYYRFIRQVFDTLKTTGTDQLIIDIRDNGGGNSGRINHLYQFLTDKKFYFTAEARMTGPARAQANDDAKTIRRLEAGAVSRRDRRLQRRLTKPLKPVKKKLRYDGKVVVLINPVSFSASGIFARMVQGSGRGKLVGDVSGASAAIMYGASKQGDPILIGPSDDFELKVNTIGLIPQYPASGNITPDYIVKPTLAGIKAGKDEQMEKAMEIVKQ